MLKMPFGGMTLLLMSKVKYRCVCVDFWKNPGASMLHDFNPSIKSYDWNYSRNRKLQDTRNIARRFDDLKRMEVQGTSEVFILLKNGLSWG